MSRFADDMAGTFMVKFTRDATVLGGGWTGKVAYWKGGDSSAGLRNPWEGISKMIGIESEQ